MFAAIFRPNGKTIVNFMSIPSFKTCFFLTTGNLRWGRFLLYLISGKCPYMISDQPCVWVGCLKAGQPTQSEANEAWQVRVKWCMQAPAGITDSMDFNVVEQTCGLTCEPCLQADLLLQQLDGPSGGWRMLCCIDLSVILSPVRLTGSQHTNHSQNGCLAAINFCTASFTCRL